MFIFIDVETTGLNPYDHDLVELAAIAIEKKKNKNEWRINPKKYYHKRLLIQNEDNVNEEALEVCHYSESLWLKTAVGAEEGLLDFNSWLKDISPSEKPIGCAHNAEFDKSMILANSDRFKIFPYINESWIDSIAIWAIYKELMGLTHLGNSNKVMCNYFKIENKKAHNALADSVASAQCLAIMLNRMSFNDI